MSDPEGISMSHESEAVRREYNRKWMNNWRQQNLELARAKARENARKRREGKAFARKFIIDADAGTVHRQLRNGKVVPASVVPNSKGYLRFVDYSAGRNGTRRFVHRAVWESVHGSIPNGALIDHINGAITDNRIENLRLSDHSLNQQNRHLARRDSSSGLKGVGYVKSTGNWRARIVIDRVVHHLGEFKSKGEAKTAYNIAAAKLHVHNPHAAGGQQ